MRAFLIIAASLVTISTAMAHDKGKIFVMPPGNDSCAQFIAASEGSSLGSYRSFPSAGVTYIERKEQYVAYALGLISGLNVTRPFDRQIKFDPAAIELSLRNYCNAHPTTSVASAVMVFAGEHGLLPKGSPSAAPSAQ